MLHDVFPAEAVQFAHRNLVVHRDLKPANILINGSGRAKLLDFGIARLLEDAEAAQQTGPLGARLTPDYAAPEQFTGQPISAATDVYALGCLMYRLLSGRVPLALSGCGLAQMLVLFDDPARAPLFTAHEFALTDGAGHEYGPHSQGLREAVAETDRRLGVVLDLLAARGLLDSTLFIFTSDHGMAAQHVALGANPARHPERIGLKTVTGEPMVWLRDLAVSVEAAPDGRTARVIVCDNDADATTHEVKATVPAGFEDWLLEAEAVADEGTDALRNFWKASAAEFRTAAADKLDALKERAKKADAKQPEVVTA